MAHTPPPRGAIGPNSLIQTAAALKETFGLERTRAVLAAGGSESLLDTPPATMVAEGEFHQLVTLLAGQLGVATATQVLGRAGELTAGYLLQHRIPGPARRVLPHIPASLSLRLLLPAVARHAWTFAGSGDFTFAAGRDPWVSIAVPRLRAAPDLATPVCAYYRATFQTLLRALVDPGITLADMACLAHGDAACIYHIGHRTLALTH